MQRHRYQTRYPGAILQKMSRSVVKLFDVDTMFESGREHVHVLFADFPVVVGANVVQNAGNARVE
jgi:hypothetical protein